LIIFNKTLFETNHVLYAKHIRLMVNRQSSVFPDDIDDTCHDVMEKLIKVANKTKPKKFNNDVEIYSYMKKIVKNHFADLIKKQTKISTDTFIVKKKDILDWDSLFCIFCIDDSQNQCIRWTKGLLTIDDSEQHIFSEDLRHVVIGD